MKVTYTRVFSDADGESHFADAEIELGEHDYAPPAPPMFKSYFCSATQVGLLGVPADFHSVRHPASQRVFVFTLSGSMEETVSDGETRSFGVGDILLNEDTTCKGHDAKISGDGLLAALVELPDE